jgi:hypothetical protein
MSNEKDKAFSTANNHHSTRAVTTERKSKMVERILDFETVEYANVSLCNAKRLLDALGLLLSDYSEGDIEPHRGVLYAAQEAVNEASELLAPTKPKVAA